MRYFRIYADRANPQPRFPGWYSRFRPGWPAERIYEALKGRDHFKVELAEGVPFMDIISHPYFMVSKEFADLIRLYRPGTAFKYAMLCDEKNRKSSLYQIPCLPELPCLDERSEVSRDNREILTGILKKAEIRKEPIFRIGGVEGISIAASLELVESACRREVRGMRLEEYMVY